MTNSTRFIYIVGAIFLALAVYTIYKNTIGKTPQSECQQQNKDWSQLLAARIEDVKKDINWMQNAYRYFPTLDKEAAIRAEAQKVLSADLGCNPN